MDVIMHFLGLCGDAPTHLDLLDVLLMGSVMPIGVVLKYKWEKFKEYLNDNFK
jgi:hypothetical protein